MSEKSVALKLLNNYKELYGLDKLSEIFNRYKKIFLSLKTSSNDDLNNRKYELKYEEIELNKNSIDIIHKEKSEPNINDKNVSTKSFILTPYNSLFAEDDDSFEEIDK